MDSYQSNPLNDGYAFSPCWDASSPTISSFGSTRSGVKIRTIPITDQRSHNSNRNGEHNTQYLCQEQTMISKHKAIPFCNRINRSFSEETCCDSSPDTTDTMAAKSIQGIVDLQLLFQKDHSKVTDRAYQDPNDKGCPYRYETSSGVMATSPITRPVDAPTSVGFPSLITSINIQVSIALALDTAVVKNACAAKPFAANALPALNPNQPNHNRNAPSATNGILCTLYAVFS